MAQPIARIASLLPVLLQVGVVFLLITTLDAQRRKPKARAPRTAAKAVEAFDKVAMKPEMQRSTALRNMARFATTEITERLTRELKEAKVASYRVQIVQAIGQKRRDGVLPLLLQLFDTKGTSSSLRYVLSNAIGSQGEAAVPELVSRITEARADASRRQQVSALLNGLGRIRHASAYEALMAAAQTGTDYDRYMALNQLSRAPKSEALTTLRLGAVQSKYELLRFTALDQLVAAKHPKAKELALKAWDDVAKSPRSRSYAGRLATALAGLLDPDTFAAFLGASAANLSAADRTLATVGKKVDETKGFVAWLIETGLESEARTEQIVSLRLLIGSKNSGVNEALRKRITSKDIGIASMAMRAAGERGDKSAVPFLRRALKSRDESRQVGALLALHDLLKGEPAWNKELRGMLRSRKIRQRVLAIDLLAEIQAKDVMATIRKDFTHRSWVVRAAAYDFCRRVRSLDSVTPLIDRVDREKGRLREDCLDALKAITSYRLPTSAAWKRWWSSSKATFKMPPLKVSQPKTRKPSGAARTVSSFFDIPLVSTRVQFVLDTSGSMSAGMGTVTSSGKSSNSRIEEAKRQLRNAVKGLPKKAVFNMIFFQSSVKAFADKAKPAGTKHRAAAIKSVDGLRAGGGTNIHDALELAFQDDDVDTIYLLSDGAPSAGKITDSNKLADEVARWNRTRRIRIHTIAVGSKSKLMERLAAESGGVHRHVR